MSAAEDDPDRRELTAWRRETRKRLIEARALLSPALREQYTRKIVSRLAAKLVEVAPRVVGLYLPLAGEIDLAGRLGELLVADIIAALPRCAVAGELLQFHQWRLGEAVELGLHGTRHPAAIAPVEPEVLLIPVVGFDTQCYRLGYGGGYYDRLLASIDRPPLTVGLGFELSKLATIRPQPHDIPLDCIVTESAVYTRDSQA